MLNGRFWVRSHSLICDSQSISGALGSKLVMLTWV